MAITIDWATRTINVPRADMALIQPAPEIRQLDLDVFRLLLKTLEASEEGMPFPDTHSHVGPLDLGDVTQARSVLLVNGYTVTFEDGLYRVMLINANSNVLAYSNVNSVSIASQNSMGLADLSGFTDSMEDVRQDVETWGVIASG
jgi:hypothetical protein